MSGARIAVILAVALQLWSAAAGGCSSAIQGVWSGTLAPAPDTAGTDAIWRLSETLLTLKVNNADFTKMCVAEFTLNCVAGTSQDPSCETAPTGLTPTETGFFVFVARTFRGACDGFTKDKLWADTTVQLDYALVQAPNPKDARLFISGRLLKQPAEACATYRFTRGLPRVAKGPPATFKLASECALGGVLLIGWVALFYAVPKCADPDYGDDDGAADPPKGGRGDGGGRAGAGAGAGGTGADIPDDRSDASSSVTASTATSAAKRVRCGGCMTQLDSAHHTICPICNRRIEAVGLVDEQFKPVRVRRPSRAAHPHPHPQHAGHPHPHPHGAHPQHHGYSAGVPPGYPAYGAMGPHWTGQPPQPGPGQPRYPAPAHGPGTGGR